jgi:hypothetical protein
MGLIADAEQENVGGAAGRGDAEVVRSRGAIGGNIELEEQSGGLLADDGSGDGWVQEEYARSAIHVLAEHFHGDARAGLGALWEHGGKRGETVDDGGFLLGVREAGGGENEDTAVMSPQSMSRILS